MTITTSARVLFAALFSFLAVGTVWGAEEATWFGQKAAGKWMVGLKGANVQNGRDGFDDASNAGLLLGYWFARPVGFNGTASIEFEGMTSTGDGDIDGTSNFGTAGRWDVDTYGLFFAYRTPGTVYFKGRLGGLHSEISNKFGTARTSTDDASLAGGAGLGVQVGEWGNIELEWTGDSGDNDLQMISLGGVLKF